MEGLLTEVGRANATSSEPRSANWPSGPAGLQGALMGFSALLSWGSHTLQLPHLEDPGQRPLVYSGL